MEICILLISKQWKNETMTMKTMETKKSKQEKEKTIKKYFLEIKISILSLRLWLAFKWQSEVSVVSRKSSSNNQKISTLNTHLKWIMVILVKMTFFTLLPTMLLTSLITFVKCMVSAMKNILTPLVPIKWCHLLSWVKWRHLSN